MKAWLTRVVDHNHSAHSHNGVKTVEAPQNTGIDAASGIANDGRFCGKSVMSPHLPN